MDEILVHWLPTRFLTEFKVFKQVLEPILSSTKSSARKHGRALLLDGLDKGLNDNARKEKLSCMLPIMSAKTISRSMEDWVEVFGCPALPQDIMDQCLQIE